MKEHGRRGQAGGLRLGKQSGRSRDREKKKEEEGRGRGENRIRGERTEKERHEEYGEKEVDAKE